MRKRILSIMLCCVMLVGLLPTTAFAADSTDYGFTINGTEVTSENIGNIPGVTGTVSYDQNTKKLTLDGVTITSDAVTALDCGSGVEVINLVKKNEIQFSEAIASISTSPFNGISSTGNVTIKGSNSDDSLKITISKENNTDASHGIFAHGSNSNLTIMSCSMDILCSEYTGEPIKIPNEVSDFAAVYANGGITIEECNFQAVIGKTRSGEMKNVTWGNTVRAQNGDITITDSKVTAGVFNKGSNYYNYAVLYGKNITLTGCELNLSAETNETNYSTRLIHTEADDGAGKVNLINCFGTLNASNGENGKCYGIDIWPAADNCLTIDGCSLTITISGINMVTEKQQAILIGGDRDTDTKKWPIFESISEFTYGDTVDSTVTKASGSTDTGFWRKHYLQITAKPTALNLNQRTLELDTGSSQPLTATVTPAHAEQNVTWTSSNETVATVENGIVTAVSAGTAVITASASGLSASCTVTVKDPVYSVTLHPNGGTISNGNVTEYAYGEGATLPTAVTRTGYTFGGWYDNEGLNGSPATEISNTETGDKEYWAKWKKTTYRPTVQKPEINVIGSGKVTLSTDGRTADITADEGYELVSITVNGKEIANTDKLTGLKTGDKVVVTFQKKSEVDTKAIAEKVGKMQTTARSSNTAKKNIRITVNTDQETNNLIKEIKDLGYTVKYKYYRSTKKASKYTAKVEKDADINSYINTSGKKGTRYYYKVRVMVYDADGNLVAKSDLKQSSYAARIWSK